MSPSGSSKKEECLFCKIIRKDIPAEAVYEDEQVLVFRDINPQAPVHLLIIPKEHFRSLNETTDKCQQLLGHILLTAKKMAEQEKVDKTGYRTLVNTEKDSGWGVEHLHFHLLGGKSLGTQLTSKD